MKLSDTFYTVDDFLVRLGGNFHEATASSIVADFSRLFRTINDESRMLSRSRTELFPLRDVAADIGLCILGFRSGMVGCPRTSQGMHPSSNLLDSYTDMTQ